MKNLQGRRKEEFKVSFLKVISEKQTFGSAFFEVRVSGILPASIFMGYHE